MLLKTFNFIKVDSTNNIASEIINQEKSKAGIVVSQIQTNGRGTKGRNWVSLKHNLFISIFFRINRELVNTDKLSLLNPKILKKILGKYTLEKIIIKHPNDLLVRNSKICGILQEVINHKNKSYLIIGIGLNSLRYAYNNNFRSISLKKISNKMVSNERLIEEIKKEYEILIRNINKLNFFQLITKIK